MKTQVLFWDGTVLLVFIQEELISHSLITQDMFILTLILFQCLMCVQKLEDLMKTYSPFKVIKEFKIIGFMKEKMKLTLLLGELATF